MAQAYQLPGEFRAGDLSAAASYSGNQTARDQEVMNNFIKQYDATTNISNANRMQSLREKQFQQQLVDEDRKFDLLSRQEESIARGRDQQYEINKYSLEQAARKDKELENAWARRDEWQGIIDQMLPNGGSDYNYKNGVAAVYRKAKTPADFAVLKGLLGPLDEQYSTFRTTDQIEKEANIQTAVETGLIDIPDEEWNQMSVLKQTDPVRYMARLGKYQIMADTKREEAKRLREREQAGIISGEMTARALARGIPESQITETYEPGKGFGFKAEPLKPIKGTTSSGTSGASTVGKYATDFAEEARKLTPDIQAAKSEVDNASDPIVKNIAEVRLRGLMEQRDIFQKAAVEQVQQVRGQAVPESQGATPSATPQTGSPGLLGPIPGAPVKPSQMNIPTTSTAPVTPVSAETPKAQEPLYYVTLDGRPLTPDEGFLAQLKGEKVIPVFEKQEESPEEKKAREDFLASASEAAGTAPLIPSNIASF
jgi:hypothetical protein